MYKLHVLVFTQLFTGLVGQLNDLLPKVNSERTEGNWNEKIRNTLSCTPALHEKWEILITF